MNDLDETTRREIDSVTWHTLREGGLTQPPARWRTTHKDAGLSGIRLLDIRHCCGHK